MRLTIKKLTMENFKGVLEPTTITFGERLTGVYGANHTGKTTTIDAVLWLLFGKNSAGQTAFGIDPKDEKGDIIHNLDNKVTATFVINNREVTISKVRHETFMRVRGTEDGTYGHTTAYYVDGEKMTEKDFKRYLEDQFISEELFRSITNPAFFPGQDAKYQRSVLINMVGDISDEDVAATDEKFADLVKKLGDTSIEDHRKHLKYQMDGIKEELRVIPARIAENRTPLAAAEQESLDFEAIARQIENINEDIAKADAAIADLSKSTDDKYESLTEKRNTINGLKTMMHDIKQHIETENAREQDAHRLRLTQLRGKVANEQAALNICRDEMSSYQKAIDKIEIRKVDFRKRWQETEDLQFEWDTHQENCPTCGQRLPEDSIEAHKVRALAKFNENKQRLQDNLDNEAADIRKTQEKYTALLSASRTNYESHEAKMATCQKELEEEQQVVVKTQDYTMDSEYLRLEEQVRYKTAELNAIIAADSSVSKEERRQREVETKRVLTELRDQLRDQLAKQSTIEHYRQRIKELEQQEKDLNQQLSTLEGEEDAAIEYQHRKIELLQNRVNSRFALVKFRMFKPMLNGSIEPTCECTLHGTPYSDLSNSEKITAGLDIINALCQHADAFAPIFIDNAESVNEMLPTESQQVQMIVSHDRELKVVI